MKYKINDYDLVLNDLIVELKKQNLCLSNTNDDGRINSIINENEVIEVLLKIYKNIPIFKEMNLIIEKQPKPRYWYDILIKNDEGFYCPINIKISDFSNSSADNISSKEGLYFSLTGEVNEKCPNTWGKYFDLLSKNIRENNTDYFFIVVDKNKNNDIIFNTMRRLKTLTPNGNNPPFQCKWSENKDIINRSFEEAKDFLLTNLSLTVKKRAQILEEFNDAFKDYAIKIK